MFGRGRQTKPRPRIEPGQRQSVFSYYHRASVEEEPAPKVQSELLLEKTRKLPTLLALIVILICLGYILSVDRNPKIIVVNEQDQSTVSLLRPVQTYQTAAQKLLLSSPLNYSKLTISTARLSKDMQATFPEITQATVSLPIINRRPVVYIQITRPAFLLNKGTDIYALDEQGRVIMKGDASIPASNLVHIVDQSVQDAVIDKQYLPMSQIQFLQSVSAQLRAKGINIASFELPNTADALNVKIQGLPYYIKMTFTEDPRLQSGAFLAVKQKLDADKVTPSEYVDVRVEERAYYK